MENIQEKNYQIFKTYLMTRATMLPDMVGLVINSLMMAPTFEQMSAKPPYLKSEEELDQAALDKILWALLMDLPLIAPPTMKNLLAFLVDESTSDPNNFQASILFWVSFYPQNSQRQKYALDILTQVSTPAAKDTIRQILTHPNRIPFAPLLDVINNLHQSGAMDEQDCVTALEYHLLQDWDEKFSVSDVVYILGEATEKLFGEQDDQVRTRIWLDILVRRGIFATADPVKYQKVLDSVIGLMEQPALSALLPGALETCQEPLLHSLTLELVDKQYPYVVWINQFLLILRALWHLAYKSEPLVYDNVLAYQLALSRIEILLLLHSPERDDVRGSLSTRIQNIFLKAPDETNFPGLSEEVWQMLNRAKKVVDPKLAKAIKHWL